MSEVERAHTQGSSEMSPPASRKLRELFLEAAEIQDAEVRAAFLDRACGNDAELRRRVEELLAADQAAGPTPTRAGAPDPHPGEGVGSFIGRYKLLQQIGEGGCGVVYMAEQVEPVRRQVALKIIKLGMDTRSVIARFEAERQALALMDHPNIAKVHDAGATETGRPYFVMELVRGIKITDYCDQHNLSTRQRLDLFVQVCDAVQHAHQKGVIHRDLKPSNILVTQRDGVPVPKVIDFGIAKAITDQRLTDKTLYTAFEQFLGTPAYMSPEQAELSELGTDTRSDIYSLGVLLYELLTGSTPFDTQELLKAGLDEMRRTIREEEPATPSSRLTQLQSPAVGGATAQSKIKNRKSKIAADLDWIVMKCLEKDRARRYATANGLAMDIQRHLNNEPVVACPPGRLYRLQKLVRRNRGVFSALAIILALLVLGVGGSTWQAVRARQAQKEAQTEALKSRQVAHFLQKMLEGVGPSVARGRDTTLLREILDRTADQVAIELKDQPLVVAQLQQTIADVDVTILDFPKGERLQRQALTTRRTLLPHDHIDVALSLIRLAITRRIQQDFPDAEALDREAVAICRKLFPKGHRLLADALGDTARVLEQKGRLNEAQVLVEDAISVLRKLPGDQRETIAEALFHLGGIRRAQGRIAEAENLMTEQLPTMRKLALPEYLAWGLHDVAVLFEEERKLPQAEDAFREALSIARSIFKDTDLRYLAESLSNLSGILVREGKFDEAEGLLQEAIEVRRKMPGDQRLEIARELFQLGSIRHEQGRKAEAEKLVTEQLPILRALGAKDLELLPWIGSSLENMGDFTLAEEWYRQVLLDDSDSSRLAPHTYVRIVTLLVGVLLRETKFDEIEASHSEWLQNVRVRLPADDPELADLLAQIMYVPLKDGRFVEAEKLARECLALREKKLPDDWRTYKTRSMLGGCLLGEKRYTEAEPLLLSACEGLRQHQAEIPPGRLPSVREDLQRPVALYEAAGRPEQAAEWRKKLEEFDRALTNAQPSAKASP